nr:hypothetical protein [Mycobacterium bourgelatii]
MDAKQGGASLPVDRDVDEIADEFLSSPYADSRYIDWTLDRRLEGFLRRHGLACLVEDGDAYDLVLDRVMVRIGAASCRRSGHRADRGGSSTR